MRRKRQINRPQRKQTAALLRLPGQAEQADTAAAGSDPSEM